MKAKSLNRPGQPLLFVLLSLCAAMAMAKDCPEGIEAATSPDLIVPAEVLSYRVMPLTLCELEVEAEAWQVFLKRKVADLSDAEVAAYYSKEMTRQARTEAAHETTAAPAQDADSVPVAVEDARRQPARQADYDATLSKATAAAAAREQSKPVPATGDGREPGNDARTVLLQYVNELTAQRTAIIDRFEVVLDELAAKGGDVDQYRAYVKAVSGIKVDVTDASATWATATSWLRSPEGGLRWIVNFVQFVFILFIFYLLSIVAGKAAHKAVSRSKSFSSLLGDFMVMSARRLVLFIGFFVGLAALEVNIGPVLAIIGAAGFVIAFALQNSLSNFASGILMLLYRPFDTGDFVSVASVLGKVETMNLLSTQLRTPDNQLVIVPNNAVWGGVITNITGITKRRVDLVFGIGYNDDIDKAQQILEGIVAEHPKILAEPQPIIRLNELADSSVNFVCRPWVTPADYWEVYWDITREVKRRFDAQGVSIPFPQRDVHIFHEKPESAE